MNAKNKPLNGATSYFPTNPHAFISSPFYVSLGAATDILGISLLLGRRSILALMPA